MLISYLEPINSRFKPGQQYFGGNAADETSSLPGVPSKEDCLVKNRPNKIKQTSGTKPISHN